MSNLKRCLVTGGAGFVGSRLSLLLANDGVEVFALDNLKRRGSELNLTNLKKAGVHFVHGDVRLSSDLESLPSVDLLIDASAEPSVHAGTNGSPNYVVHTNLNGTYHMLEWSRKHDCAFLLLSTSRVYPIAAIEDLPFREDITRFTWESPYQSGISQLGLSESFTLNGARSLYGTSKLCSEHLLEEYVHTYGLRGMINRCGILAGSHQMGKVDQGVVALWVANHLYKGRLTYNGFGGLGKQVRDLLHVNDLYRLISLQCQSMDHWNGNVFNVGGGISRSVSLFELTQLCQEVTSNIIEIGSKKETSPLDLKCYITDHSRASEAYSWKPKFTCLDIVQDIFEWLISDPIKLRPLFV